MAPQPPVVEKLEILWRTPIVPDVDHNYSISMNPVLHEGMIVFNSEFAIDGHQAPVLFLDTSDGRIQNYWSDYIDGNALYSGETSASEDDFLFLSTHNSIDCVNLRTAKTQWRGKYGNNGPHIYTSEGYIYRAIEYDGTAPTKAAILRSPVQSQNWDTVYSFTKTDKYNPSFDSFGFGNLENGDKVIVWKNRNWGAAGSLTDIFAFNLSADTLLWRNRALDINSGVIPLQINNGVVYGLVRHRAFAIDLQAGTLLWDKNLNQMAKPSLPLEFVDGDLHIEQNKILVKDQSDELIAINRNNGNLEWVRQNHGSGMNARFTYFESKLFFPSDGLRIVDATNGEPLISETLSEEIDDIKSKIVIDPNRRVMYFHNGREAFCVKIPAHI